MIEETGYHRRDVEIQLGYARLYLTNKEKDKARNSLAKAKKIIKDQGCHRWDIDVKEIEDQLK